MRNKNINLYKNITNIDGVESLIFTFRGEKVMLDRDLSVLYGIETKRLNEQVKRNLDRFEDFYFQLSNNERDELVAKCDRFSLLKHSSSNPYVFNEYGILTLSSVLKSKIAIEINRKIIKTFVAIRKQTIEMSAYELMQEKVKVLQSQIEEIKTSHLVIDATLSAKATHLSKELMILRENIQEIYTSIESLENAHIIIKRPNEDAISG
jgi:uncharacterized protein YydD (DUF2326 family)